MTLAELKQTRQMPETVKLVSQFLTAFSFTALQLPDVSNALALQILFL